ncbi:hypothetical protein [Oscillatoria sp. HE19RPO]|uniref:hypothetical protein n=1 Tax=Oscillatoria sp. HE19RPO TaxID=2954806 RepID=UPI0035C83CCA
MGPWSLVIGYWLLVIGYWLLVVFRPRKAIALLLSTWRSPLFIFQLSRDPRFMPELLWRSPLSVYSPAL